MAAYHTQNKQRVRERQRSRYFENHEVELAVRAEWRAKNSDKMKGYLSTYYEANRELVNQRTSTWKKDNPDRVKASAKLHYSKNASRYNAHTARRRATQEASTPIWADVKSIDAIYAMCKFLNAVTGKGVFSVDHVVPIKSERVCGLHVPANLAIIPLVANKVKNNRHWPDMS